MLQPDMTAATLRSWRIQGRVKARIVAAVDQGARIESLTEIGAFRRTHERVKPQPVFVTVPGKIDARVHHGVDLVDWRGESAVAGMDQLVLGTYGVAGSGTVQDREVSDSTPANGSGQRS